MEPGREKVASVSEVKEAVFRSEAARDLLSMVRRCCPSGMAIGGQGQC